MIDACHIPRILDRSLYASAIALCNAYDGHKLTCIHIPSTFPSFLNSTVNITVNPSQLWNGIDVDAPNQQHLFCQTDYVLFLECTGRELR